MMLIDILHPNGDICTLNIRAMNRALDQPYAVLLYYQYTPIADTAAFWEEHYNKCLELGLRGRIIIAEEGLNGTVSGTVENCSKYMDFVRSLPGFETTDFKVDHYEAHAFHKLNIRIKNEIVNAGLPTIDPNKKTGKHLSAAEFKKLKSQEDVVLLDVRSNYEHNLGRFKGAKTLDIENFREFKNKLEELADLKDKKIITYCTGGIKCEKASAYLLEQGFEEVYQLHGGIIKYGLEAGGEDFEGKCYVFDNRVAVEVNQVNPEVVSTCFVCGTKTDHMVNCANPDCNRHEPICEECLHEMEGACSESCKESPKKRPYNPEGYFSKRGNGYDPAKGLRQRRLELKSKN